MEAHLDENDGTPGLKKNVVPGNHELKERYDSVLVNLLLRFRFLFTSGISESKRTWILAPWLTRSHHSSVMKYATDKDKQQLPMQIRRNQAHKEVRWFSRVHVRPQKARTTHCNGSK